MSSGKLPALVSKDDDDPIRARRDSAASSPPQASKSAQVAGRLDPPPLVPPPPTGQERVPIHQRPSLGRVLPIEQQRATTPPRQGLSSRYNPGTTGAGTGIGELPANVSAPNLTHYVHHVHHYTFNAPCTIYQVSGEGNPEIYTEPGTYTYTHTERQGWPPAPGGGLRTQPPGERYYSAPAPPIFPSATRTEHRAHTHGEVPRHAPAPRSRANEPQGTSPSHRQPATRTPPVGATAGPETRSFTLAPFPYASPARDNSQRGDFSGGVGYRRRHDPSTASLPGAEEPPSKRPYRTMSAPHGSLLASRPGQHQYAPGASSGDVHSEVRIDPMQGVNRARSGPVQEGTAKSSSPSDEAVQQSSPYFSVGASASGAQYSALQSSSTNTFATVGDQESNINDWEYIVNMYLTGQGTADGIPLRDKPKGPGSNRQDGDRKMLEKRRTIGKTYEKLGKELFELAIGYRKDEATGARRKQRMYHVIARCRVVNQMRKSLQEIPADGEELSRIIDERIAEKQQIKRGEEALGPTTLPGLRIPHVAGPSGTHGPQHPRSDFREHPPGVLFRDQQHPILPHSQPHSQYFQHQHQPFQSSQYPRLPQPQPPPPQQQQPPQQTRISRLPFQLPSPRPSEQRSKQGDPARTPPPG